MKGKVKGFVLAVGALFLIGAAPAYSEVKHNDDASLLMQIGPYAYRADEVASVKIIGSLNLSSRRNKLSNAGEMRVFGNCSCNGL